MKGTLNVTLKDLNRFRVKVPILTLIRQHVKLTKAGDTWKGRCPFHEDTNPSFRVHPGKGIFHCFGCGVGGDIFGWLMRYHRLTFPEAVAWVRRQNK